MHCVRNVTDDLFFVGASDRRLMFFEGFYPVPDGMAYNSYLLMDEKTALMDAVDKAVSEQFFENLEHLLGDRPLDYLILHHLEPDHSATLSEVVRRYPGVELVMSAKAEPMARQFYGDAPFERVRIVKEGDSLPLGRHTLTFYMAPMVHWPEVMVSYDSLNRTLFSADAFGLFGAMDGHIFDDELPFDERMIGEARRYYTNIVGKYGAQVQALLKKMEGLSIDRICSLHGPIFRAHIGEIVEKYRRWSSYQSESPSVMIAYASVYGNTQNAANILAMALAERGVADVSVYDVSVTHPSYTISEAFRCSHLVFAATTYNMNVFVTMEHLLRDLVAHNLQNRTVALIENGSWAPAAKKHMTELLSGLKGIEILPEAVTIRSSVRDAEREALMRLADAIAASVRAAQ